jgi:hypothetical protein
MEKTVEGHTCWGTPCWVTLDEMGGFVRAVDQFGARLCASQIGTWRTVSRAA